MLELRAHFTFTLLRCFQRRHKIKSALPNISDVLRAMLCQSIRQKIVLQSLDNNCAEHSLMKIFLMIFGIRKNWNER